MRPSDPIDNLFLQTALKTNRAVDSVVLEDAFRAMSQPKPVRPDLWRILMHSRMTKPIVMVLLAAVMIGIFQITGSIDGAGKVYAAAFDSIQHARTFSCREISEIKREGVGKCILEQEWSFREPDMERHVYISGVDDRFLGEVTITDYSKRQQLVLNPVKKTALYSDKSTSFEIDPHTGKLRLTQLDTSIRETLLEMRIKAVEDLGEVEVDGRILRMLQSQKGDRVTTVWVDSQSGLPVEIKIQWLEQNRRPVWYKSIRIDEPLDDNLFSFEPPDGYQMERFTYDWPVYKKKISTKMKYLMRACAIYSTRNDGQFPETLAELESTGITSEILHVILAAPDQESGPAVMQYCPPRPDREWSTEIIMYEIYDQWPEDGIVVGFADCHSELINDQPLFEALLK